MTTKEPLTALAERVEGASADAEKATMLAVLEALAAAKLFDYSTQVRMLKFIEAGAFLDAAMTLVPEGMKLVLDTHHNIATVYHYWMISAPEDEGFTSYQAEAATPALALTAAALRSRGGSHEQG